MELKTFIARIADGPIVPGATYYVYLADTLTLATIYDKDGATIANPGSASASGQIAFAAADGDYDLRVTDGLTLDNQIRVRFVDVATASNLSNNTDSAKGSGLVGYTDGAAGSVGTTAHDKLARIVYSQDFDALADGTSQTAKVNAAKAAVGAGEVICVQPGVRHSTQLSDVYQLGVENRYSYNINSATFSNTLNANIDGINSDKQIYLFGDSHSWGQGSPEWDALSGATFSAHSASLFNNGFMARIEQFIKQKNAIDDKVHTVALGTSTDGLRLLASDYVQDRGYESQDYLTRSGEVLSGVVLCATGAYAPPISSHKGWFTPFATDELSLITYYQDKIFKGRFNKGLFRILPETEANFHDSGKHEYLSLLPVPGIAATGGYTAVTDSNGNVLAEGDGTKFFLRVSTKTPYTQLGFFSAAGQSYFIPGYGKFVIGAGTLIGSGAAVAIRIYAADGTSYPTGIDKFLFANMKIFKHEYVNSCVVRFSPENAFRKMYIAVRKTPGGRKLFVGLRSVGSLTAKWHPVGRLSPASDHSVRPQWNWGRSGYPKVNIVTVSGGRTNAIAAGDAALGAGGVIIDTYAATTADVVYEIDYGSRTLAPVYVQDYGVSGNGSSTNTCSRCRGLLFGNNGVTNWAMGGHTIGNWMGYGNSFNDPAYDHLADIIAYSKATPYLVVTQLPLVNEYLRQTPLATFKANIATFMSRLNGTLNSGGGKVTDFLFFTTLGHKDVEFEGATSSAITYDDYVAAAKEQCGTSGAGFVDVRAMIKDMVSSGLIDYRRLFNNNTHPAAFANELIAAKVIDILDEVL